MSRKNTTVDTGVMIYLCLLSVAEFVTTHNLRAGMAIHGGILFALLLHGVMVEDQSISNMYTSLSIAPLIRILSLSIPLLQFENMLWFVIVGIPLFIAIFTCMHIQHLDRRSVGLVMPSRKDVSLTCGIIVLGVLLGWMEYQILKPGLMIAASASWITPILILLVCTGFLEELLFRGLLQHTFTETMGVRGIYVVSVIFGIFHIGNSIYDCFFAAMVGFIYASVVQRTGSIYGVSISHGTINIMFFLVIPYLALSS